jgi:hypothetical protein
MVLPLLATSIGAIGGTLLGGSLLGKKDYTTNTTTTYEAPYHTYTYSPTSTYAPTYGYSYVGGTYVLNSSGASARGGSGVLSLMPSVSTEGATTDQLGSGTLGTGTINGLLNNPNLMTYALIGGGTLVLYALFRKK